MAGKRVLVIDDDPLVLRSVRMALIYMGYTVETAGNGLDALQRLETEAFDLVLTDWKMPRMKGDDVADEIRKRYPLVPILLLTGSILESPPTGFDSVLFKPFSMQELREAVTALSPRNE